MQSIKTIFMRLIAIGGLALLPLFGIGAVLENKQDVNAVAYANTAYEVTKEAQVNSSAVAWTYGGRCYYYRPYYYYYPYRPYYRGYYIRESYYEDPRYDYNYYYYENYRPYGPVYWGS